MQQKRFYTAGLFICLALAFPSVANAAEEYINDCDPKFDWDYEVN